MASKDIQDKATEVYMPISLLDELRQNKDGGGILCGKISTASIQVVSQSSIWRGLKLQEIGQWSKDNLEATYLVLHVTENDCTATFNNRKLKVNLYDQNDYHSRHRTLAMSGKLENSCVALVGMGTIGSKMALDFAKHKVRQAFFDPDIFQIDNPYRMGITVPAELIVGEPKCHACLDFVKSIVPGAIMYPYAMDIALEQRVFAEILSDIQPQLIICSVDTLDGLGACSNTAKELQIPVLAVTLSNGAESGQIHFYSAQPDEPCLLCFGYDESSTMRTTSRQYAEESSQAQKAVPSLSVDTTIIASIATKIAMAYLCGEDISRYFSHMGNTGQVMWISTTPDTWIFEDFAQKIVAKVLKNPKCPGCWEPDKDAILKRRKERIYVDECNKSGA